MFNHIQNHITGVAVAVLMTWAIMLAEAVDMVQAAEVAMEELEAVQETSDTVRVAVVVQEVAIPDISARQIFN